jgi:hypothetical protein
MKRLVLVLALALAPKFAGAQGTIPPLSSADVAAVSAGLKYCAEFDWQRTWALKIEGELARGYYAIVDKDHVDVARFALYRSCMQSNPTYRNALAGYLNIIDQRDPATDQLLPLGDPRIKYVSGPAPAPSPAPAPAPAPAPTPAAGNIVHIGGTASPLAAEQGFGQAMLSISAGDPSVGGTAGLLMTARSPVSSTFMHQNGGDEGWRLFHNAKPCGADTLCPANPNMGQITVMIEKDGSYSWTYVKPQNAGAGPFETAAGKSLSIYPGGFNTAARGPFVDMFSGQAGRGLRIGLTLSGANNPTWMFQLNPNGTTAIMIDGVMRTLHACGNTVCF